MRKVLALAFALLFPVFASAQGWTEDFGPELDLSRWTRAEGWVGPGYIYCDHISWQQEDHVYTKKARNNWFLVLELTQEPWGVDGCLGVLSRGALVYTNQSYGYGSYEWRARFSSSAPNPVSRGDAVLGSSSGAFTWYNNSETEIDFEQTATSPGNVFAFNFHNLPPIEELLLSEKTTTILPVWDVSSDYHVYRFDWLPGEVRFFIDNELVATHTTNVPELPAPVMMNHWGWNTWDWGGPATIGVTRKMFIDWVKFTPAQ